MGVVGILRRRSPGPVGGVSSCPCPPYSERERAKSSKAGNKRDLRAILDIGFLILNTFFFFFN